MFSAGGPTRKRNTMQSASNASSTTKPRRRWFQFGVRGLLVVVTLCAMLVACWKAYVGQYHLQRLVADGIREVGGKCETEPTGPQWLARLLGEHDLVSVVSVQSFPAELTNEQLEQLRCLTELKSIRLYFPNDGGLQFVDDRMPFVANLTSLEEFSFFGRTGALSDEGLKYLARLTNLRTFGFWTDNEFITDEGLTYLTNLRKLESVNLVNAEIDGSGLVHLAHLSKLRTLFLDGTQTTDAQLVHLQSLLSLSQLSLSNTPVGDKGLEHLCRMRHLEDLNLAGTRITDAGLAQLSGLTELESLNVGATQIGDAALKHLSALTNLYQLSLARTQVTDAGLQTLRLPKLVFLDLEDTAVTDAGLENLKAFPLLIRVRTSRSAHLTDAGVARLQESLPQLQIELSQPGESP